MVTKWEHYCGGPLIVLSLAVALTCVTAGLAQANELTVLNLNDTGPGSLRAAILAANENPGADVIRFARQVTATIVLSNPLNITDDLRIDGPGDCRLTLSGGQVTRVFEMSGGETDVLIGGLTIANGMATGTTVAGSFGPVTLGGGILNTGARVTLCHVRLADNQVVAAAPGTTAGGGGIANVFGATLTVKNCTFTSNHSIGASANDDSYGGGIFSDAFSKLTITYSTFTDNAGRRRRGAEGAPSPTRAAARRPCRTVTLRTTWPTVPTVVPAGSLARSRSQRRGRCHCQH